MPRLRDVGRQSLDLLSTSVIPEGTTPEASERIARRMLELTPLGYSQVIRVETRPRTLPDGTSVDHPIFVLSHTGEEFTDLEKAVREANKYGMVSYANLSGNPDARINRQLPYGELLEERERISELLATAKRNPRGPQAKALRDLGLGDLLDEAVVKSIPRRGRAPKDVVDFEIRAISVDTNKGSMDMFRVGGDPAGEMLGIASASDDGFNFLEYGLPGKKLTQTQIAALKSLVGSPRQSPYQLASKIGKEGGLESSVAKLGKRQRGYESPRQFSVSGRGITDFLRSGSGKSTLADATLKVDARAELLTAAFADKIQGMPGGTRGLGTVAKDLEDRYDALSYKFYHSKELAAGEGANILDAILDPSKTSQRDYLALGKLLRDAHTAAQTSGKSVTKEFEDLVGSSRLSNSVKNAVKLTLDKMEVSVDGVFVINKKHLESYILGKRDARGNLVRAKSGVNKGRLTSTSLLKTYEGYYSQYLEQGDMMDAEDVQRMRDLRAQIETFATLDEREFTRSDGTRGVRVSAEMRDVESLNARIGVGGGPFDFLKGRGRIVDDLADDVSIVIPDIMVKGETGFQEFMNFDVLDGRHTDAINPDLQMLLFHREAFTEVDPVTGKVGISKVTMNYAEGQMNELDEILRTGIVPERVREKMMQDLTETNRETFELVFGRHKYGSKAQNKEMARRLNDALISGNVTDPEVVNALTNYYRRQVFDEAYTNNKRLRILKTPDLFRFDIEAEFPSLQGQDTPLLLATRRDPSTGRMVNKGVESIGFDIAGPGGSTTKMVDFSRARVYNHRLLFGGLSSVTHQASLGGFDFDDKGLPALRSFVDNTGRKRTAFMTFRQPTGPSEFLVQTISKDYHTLNELFGKNDQFKNTLLDLADNHSDDTIRNAAREMHEYMSFNIKDMSKLDDAQASRFAELHRKFAGIGVSKKDIAARRLLGTKDSRLFDESYDFFKNTQVAVDSVIDAAYEQIHGRGVQAIPERLMNLMVNVGGGSPLTLTPELMRKAARELSAEELEFLSPYYFRGQFFRLFGETAPTEFLETERQMMVEGIRKHGGATDAVLDRMISKTGDTFDMADQEFRENIGRILQSNLPDASDTAAAAMRKQVVLAEFEKSMEIYRTRLNFGDAQQSILGSYVNKLMAIGSTVDQFEDSMTALRGAGGQAAAFADFIAENVTTPFIIPEEAVDYTKTTGTMRIRGTGTTAADVTQRNRILQAFSLAAEAGMSENPAAVGATLERLGISSLDEQGELIMQHLGMRIALMQAGVEALGMDDAIEKFGIDPRLFNLKVQGTANVENIGRGIQEGLRLAQQFAEDAGLDADSMDRLSAARTRLEGAIGADFKTVGELISISAESTYATASIHLGAADNFNTRLQNANRRSYQARSAAEIDIFYMKRQGAPIAADVQSEAARIVRESQDQMKMFDQFQKEINRADAAEGFEKGQLERARANLGESVRQDIVDSVERLRAAGYDNLTELDFYDAIQLEERTQKVAHRELATLGEIDPGIPNRLSELKRLSELRRNYFGIVSDRSFEGSDVQKIQQVIDRHLSYMTPAGRAEAEEALTQADETQKMIFKILNIDSTRRTRPYMTGRGGTPRVPTLSELTSGIMGEDEFREIAGYLHLARNDEARATAMAAGDATEIERNISGVKKAAADVSTIYKARAAGFESMYMDPATGRVTIPAVIDAAAGGTPGATRTLSGQKYKRISQAIRDGDLKRLIDKPYVKGTIAGIVALGAFGFIHSARKDHTPEDMTGPPLLPGGSAYESGYPGNSLNLTPKNYPMISEGNGVTYKINVSGSNANARRFGQSLGALMPGASSATYYNNIRDLNIDPYKEMGSSF